MIQRRTLPAADVPERRRRFAIPLPRRFRERLLLAVCALVVGSQLVVGLAVSRTVREDSFEKARGELEVGRRVFEKLVSARAADLLETVRVLAADYGFKSAVATRDTTTIASVLENHGARVGADLVVLVDNGGDLVAATRALGDAVGARPFEPLHLAAQRSGEGTGVALVRDRLVQLVAVPVRAPLPVAWVMMGFEIDEALARELKELTHLEISFVGDRPDGPAAVVSTLGAEDAAALRQARSAWTAAAGGEAFLALGERYLTTAVPLPVAPPAEGFGVLQLPEALVTGAARALEGQFAVVLILTLALSLGVGLVMARGISRPIQRLVAAAAAIRAGNYDHAVAVRGGGELSGLAEALNDMRQGIARREQRIRHQAVHDALTGLPNRRYVEQAVAQRVRGGGAFALLRIDVLGFRAVNDSLGYEVGDRLLVALAGRLREALRPGTEVARIGGDEFLVIFDGADCVAATARGRELHDRIAAPFDIDGSPVAIGVAMGIVESPRQGREENRLLRRADIALGRARALQEPVCAYREGDDEQHLRELTLIRDLVVAIREHQLSMVYQPKIHARTGVVEQAEALVRWNHPELGQIPPDEFVFLAERSGQVTALTAEVVGLVLDQVAAWRRQGIGLVACINLSAHDLTDPRFPARLQAAITRRGLRAEDVVLEITESALVEDVERARQVLEALRAMGLELAVDDYGTGYSSLSQLRRLPVTELKIDKSFVLALEQEPEDQEIVRSTIMLGHALGLTVVAEGLESAAAWRLLDAWGCDRLQGYLVARPMPAEDLPAWLAHWDPARTRRGAGVPS